MVGRILPSELRLDGDGSPHHAARSASGPYHGRDGARPSQELELICDISMTHNIIALYQFRFGGPRLMIIANIATSAGFTPGMRPA